MHSRSGPQQTAWVWACFETSRVSRSLQAVATPMVSQETRVLCDQALSVEFVIRAINGRLTVKVLAKNSAQAVLVAVQ